MPMVTELWLPDKNEYSLDEIPIAVDSEGRCYLNVDDEKPPKHGNVIVLVEHLILLTDKSSLI